MVLSGMDFSLAGISSHISKVAEVLKEEVNARTVGLKAYQDALSQLDGDLADDANKNLKEIYFKNMVDKIEVLCPDNKIFRDLISSDHMVVAGVMVKRGNFVCCRHLCNFMPSRLY